MWVTEVETEPIAPERLAALGWTSRSGLITQHNIMENYRLTSRHTIVFGVRQIERATSYPLPERRPDPAVVADLARAFARRFPPLADVVIAHAWGGWIGITSTWLPVAGTTGDDVYYSLACNGHGLAQATYIGSLIANRIATGIAPDDLRTIWADEPKFGRGVPMIMGRPGLRAAWAVDRFNDMINGSTGSMPRGRVPTAHLFAANAGVPLTDFTGAQLGQTPGYHPAEQHTVATQAVRGSGVRVPLVPHSCRIPSIRSFRPVGGVSSCPGPILVDPLRQVHKCPSWGFSEAPRSGAQDVWRHVAAVRGRCH
ncbi:FAD-binding oxidoreductase [Amycolatopsis sp. CA-128772]|uniref:NAD(P)/FAD-dependent oxidoreductase n=1 Tax=Amycolatopsis sp. CA-128772 TaxID=2073159 RepID=UPI001E4A4ECE|nr:FAD-dependent oxidoreductase [Amycolatopsis sp. CA-128772]